MKRSLSVPSPAIASSVARAARPHSADRVSACWVGTIALAASLARLFWLARGPEASILAVVPDDAFYYLVLARNFAFGAGWTFDGVAPATGFHLGWAYLLAGIHWLAPDVSWRTLFVWLGGLSSVMYGLAAALTAMCVARAFGAMAHLGVLLTFLSSTALVQPTFMVESAPVVLCAAFLVFLVTPNPWPAASRPARAVVMAVAAGVLGMLSRSDFGLLPAVLLLAACASRMLRGPAVDIRLPAAALAGSVVGLGLVALHTYLVSGAWLPASADVKHFWAAVNGFSFFPSYELMSRLVYPFSGTALDGPGRRALYLVAVSVAAALVVRRRPGGPAASYVLFVGVGAVVGYLVLYRQNGAVQIWYAASFMVPLAIVVSAAASVVASRWPLAWLVLVATVGAAGLASSLQLHYPWQDAMRRAGLYLREHRQIDPVGAWNAGLISYFSGRAVVNLDGLVNDAVVPYVKADRLVDYLAVRDIGFIIDFPHMLSGHFAKSHGHGEGRLASCLEAPDELPRASADDAWGESYVTVYRVRPECRR